MFMNPAGVVGVFFGMVTTMERLIKVLVMFYLLRERGNMLRSDQFPQVGEHLCGSVNEGKKSSVDVNDVQRSEAVLYIKLNKCQGI